MEDLTFSADDYETNIPYFSTAQDFNYFNTIGMAKEQTALQDPEGQAI